ncbi:ATP-dependent 6-phosphofructokinase [Maribacter polysaccharolyticus]|uniref:ATP-dependent 6-phosphofructokinase n=1 Tax=Maribacter polysaccharolyticus TaxID=3020831 RepID=UPI00237F7F58|nr:ATP-dependent 6-phosphofructokinase [Maribacter polysaccharolyticus]MDE3743682.1 ATP-dependent 6-phosphofructokinase [Maribacter polysaccharolyticus]
MADVEKFDIDVLGEATYDSPLGLSKRKGDDIFNFVTDNDRILRHISLKDHDNCVNENLEPVTLEKAGPREKIYFNTKKTKAAIVTCGGLCPGINNVIRSLVMGLHYFYEVKEIVGVRYGYEGLIPSYGHGFVDLTPASVNNIHQFGGTILGSSRGGQDVEEMVNTLYDNGIDMLFAIGGDGTLKGANAIGEEIARQGLNISIIGIPKTIDNDVSIIDKTFGFETAYNVANAIIRDAHNEATGAYNGIAIVKLMGRDSGFIAASAAISMPVVNFVLVPEMHFELEGENGFLETLKKRLDAKQHAVIVVAEGAGQNLFDKDDKEQVTDASGNIQHDDIGILLKNKISEFFKKKDYEVTIKYIDPSYIIRSAPANPGDSVFCSGLAYHALHGAMAGKTKFVVGVVNNQYVYLPISAVTSSRKKINMEGGFWFAALESTGQPFEMR